MTSADETFMQRCLQLALNGKGLTYPNPLVGAVIVRNGEVIGEGWHRQAGLPHAEVMAVRSVKNKTWLKESTLYVNLEPCSFHGRTPACSTMIIREGIPRVVIGTTDPNPRVSGAGIEMLRNAGVEVISGVLEKESRELNRIFFTNQQHRRPYVLLKWSQSADGFIAGPGGKTITISHIWSRQLVHKWRSELQAILIGRHTLDNDNPQLNSRLWNDRSPVPVILTSAPLATDYRVAQIHSRIFIWPGASGELNPPYEKLEADNLADMLRELYEKGITSILVEGGRETLQSFLDTGLWDEARIFTSPVRLHDGITAPALKNARWLKTETVHTDKLDYYTRIDNPYVYEGAYL